MIVFQNCQSKKRNGCFEAKLHLKVTAYSFVAYYRSAMLCITNVTIKHCGLM